MQRAKKQFDACQKPLDKYTYLMALQVHLHGVFFLVLPILCLLLGCLLWILDRHLVIIDMWTNAHIGDMHKKHRYVHIQIEFIFGTFGLFW